MKRFVPKFNTATIEVMQDVINPLPSKIHSVVFDKATYPKVIGSRTPFSLEADADLDQFFRKDFDNVCTMQQFRDAERKRENALRAKAIALQQQFDTRGYVFQKPV